MHNSPKRALAWILLTKKSSSLDKYATVYYNDNFNKNSIFIFELGIQNTQSYAKSMGL